MNIFFLPNGYCMLRKEFPVPVFKNLVCEMTRCYVTKWFFSGQGERSAMHQTASKTTETEEDGGCNSHFHDCLLNINADCWNVWLLEDEVDRAGRQRNHAIWKKKNNNTEKCSRCPKLTHQPWSGIYIFKWKANQIAPACCLKAGFLTLYTLHQNSEMTYHRLHAASEMQPVTTRWDWKRDSLWKFKEHTR